MLALFENEEVEFVKAVRKSSALGYDTMMRIIAREWAIQNRRSNIPFSDIQVPFPLFRIPDKEREAWYLDLASIPSHLPYEKGK